MIDQTNDAADPVYAFFFAARGFCPVALPLLASFE